MSDLHHHYPQSRENPYLMTGFWHFAIMSTLMVCFFPWSLLFCVTFFGTENTKFIVLALLYDAVRTILAILAVLLVLLIFIIFLVVLFV